MDGYIDRCMDGRKPLVINGMVHRGICIDVTAPHAVRAQTAENP
jgi:hypothetical protein